MKKQDRDGAEKYLKLYLPIFIILIALLLRLTYGYNRPVNEDETEHLECARTISLHPDTFHLPLGNQVTNHTILSVYITAVADTIGGHSVYFIRISFILLSIFGLVGLFKLSALLFGYRAANFALILAALDHHLISSAPVFLEPVYLCLVPWFILTIYKAVALEQHRHLLTAGILFGLGYQCSEIFSLLCLPTFLYVLFSGKAGSICKNKMFYWTLLIVFCLIMPNLIWNINSRSVNLVRHTERISSLGLVPRVLLLYVGDIMICFKDSSCWVLGLGNKSYLPWNIPCHWVPGLLYLGSMCYSLRYFKDNRFLMLHLFVWCIFVPVSFLNANETWNEFGWASMTVFPAILLTAYVIDRLFDNKVGKIIFAIVFVTVLFHAVTFSSGPGGGYASPCREKKFLGEVLLYHIQGDKIRAGRLADEAAAISPECAIAHYFESIYASGKKERETALMRVLELEPFNPLVTKYVATDLLKSGKNQKAKKILDFALNKKYDFLDIRKLLGQAEYGLGNYSEAENHFSEALKMKPDEFKLYHSLFLLNKAQGNHDKAIGFLDRYAVVSKEPYKIYLEEAQTYIKENSVAQAEYLYSKARELNKNLPEVIPLKKGIVGR